LAAISSFSFCLRFKFKSMGSGLIWMSRRMTRKTGRPSGSASRHKLAAPLRAVAQQPRENHFKLLFSLERSVHNLAIHIFIHLISFSPSSVQFKGEINDALPRKRHQKRHLEFCSAYLPIHSRGLHRYMGYSTGAQPIAQLQQLSRKRSERPGLTPPPGGAQHTPRHTLRVNSRTGTHFMHNLHRQTPSAA